MVTMMSCSDTGDYDNNQNCRNNSSHDGNGYSDNKHNDNGQNNIRHDIGL